MWCSATGDADRWPPPGSLVIADLAQQTRDEHLKLTLLDWEAPGGRRDRRRGCSHCWNRTCRGQFH